MAIGDKYFVFPMQLILLIALVVSQKNKDSDACPFSRSAISCAGGTKDKDTCLTTEVCCWGTETLNGEVTQTFCFSAEGFPGENTPVSSTQPKVISAPTDKPAKKYAPMTI